MPTPVSEQRDDIGRLIAATFEAGPAYSNAASDNGWLVAVDGSDHSLRAVAQAARLAADLHGRAIDLIDVQPWLGKEAAETQLPQRGWAATARSRALLDAAGVPWRVHAVMAKPRHRSCAWPRRWAEGYRYRHARPHLHTGAAAWLGRLQGDPHDDGSRPRRAVIVFFPSGAIAAPFNLLRHQWLGVENS